MSDFKAKIAIAQLLRLTIVSAKSKIYSPRRGYLSPGNSIILEIAATLLFISVTIFCWFWGSFCWNSSTFPTDQFIFVNPSCLQSNTKNILPYHISTLSSKIQYTAWYYNSQRQKISQNPFLTKHLLKQTAYLLLEAKTSSYFIACTQSCQITMYFRFKPFPEEPSLWIILHKIILYYKTWWIHKGDLFQRIIFWNKQHICY